MDERIEGPHARSSPTEFFSYRFFLLLRRIFHFRCEDPCKTCTCVWTKLWLASSSSLFFFTSGWLALGCNGEAQGPWKLGGVYPMEAWKPRGGLSDPRCTNEIRHATNSAQLQISHRLPFWAVHCFLLELKSSFNFSSWTLWLIVDELLFYGRCYWNENLYMELATCCR